MNFINLPVAFRGRRLVQVLSGKITNTKLNAGYDPHLGATLAEVPYKGKQFSLILVLPGKQTEFIAGGLSKIESRLNVTLWNGLLRQMAPHKIDFKMPFFRHRSVIDNLKDSFISMEMKSAFSPDDADFSGVNGGRDLWLSQVFQINELKVDAGGQEKNQQPHFTSSSRLAGRRGNHREARRTSIFRKRLTRQNDDHDHHHDSDHHQIHHSESSSEKSDSVIRVYFERQFMYAVRHNPTGMIVYIGRYYQPEEGIEHDHHGSHHDHSH